MSCAGSAGISHTVTVAGTSRCFRLVAPSSSGSSGGAAPVLLMMHGRSGDSSQFCTQDFASTATSYGLALVCLQAVAGSWTFGPLPWSDVHDDFGLAADATGNACDDSDSDDLAYVRAVLSHLTEDESGASGASPAYDSARFFVAGFSQGALMAEPYALWGSLLGHTPGALVADAPWSTASSELVRARGEASQAVLHRPPPPSSGVQTPHRHRSGGLPSLSTHSLTASKVITALSVW